MVYHARYVYNNITLLNDLRQPLNAVRLCKSINKINVCLFSTNVIVDVSFF